ncbi:MAG: HEAT repeat domain-containing protein, partial [Phycisphaerae bacterium]|nr:HEAT repeat domain-containing protein [Phycisphaerae bacterium]
EDLSLLKECLKDDDSGVRGAAAEAIGKLGTHEDLPLLVECLKNSDSDVRQAMVQRLSVLLTGAAVAGCPATLLHDVLLAASTGVSSAAARALGRVAAPKHIREFLSKHQSRMTTSALGVLDWYLHAPARLREAYEQSRQESDQ